jgi:23S rRNA (adenine2503-C2)-methyltransferase
MELLGKSKNELRDFCQTLGEPAYRGGQIYHALYAERKADVRQMTNLPAAFRQRLALETQITLPSVKQRYISRDESVRYLFALPDGTDNGKQRPASVEAVFMPSDGRQTICISTQAGCAVDCRFCLTAQLGLIRNLTSGEMLGQVLVAMNDAAPRAAASADAVQTNVVLMGQGEPLLNFDAVMAALRILLDAEGIGVSPKHVTLSTSGMIPGIERLAKEKTRPKLAISLNASHDEQRDALMPINRKYPLGALLKACQNYPLRPWEHLTFEYVMLGGLNDSADDARRVVRLLGKLKSAKVNLIPWNPGELPYRESSPEAIAVFRQILTDRGVPTFVRYSRGRDVMAACGQLALKDVSSSSLTILG